MSHFVSPFNLVSTVFKVTTTQQQSHCERVFDMAVRKVNKRIIFLYSSCSHHLPSLLVSIIIKLKNVKTYFSFLTSSPLMTQASALMNCHNSTDHSKIFQSLNTQNYLSVASVAGSECVWGWVTTDCEQSRGLRILWGCMGQTLSTLKIRDYHLSRSHSGDHCIIWET